MYTNIKLITVPFPLAFLTKAYRATRIPVFIIWEACKGVSKVDFQYSVIEYKHR